MAQDQKQEAIILAALRRFAHFGVAKTTMNEIAADLSLSKASLYYYFPDKLSLYAAVFQHITESSTKTNDELLENEKDPWKAIVVFLQIRTDFIIKYYNILEFLKGFTLQSIPKELAPLFSSLQQRNLKRLTTIIDRGIKSKKLKIRDSRKTAELYYDFLEGFRNSMLSQNPDFFPDKKQFQAILKREIEFSQIFFDGLTH